jgi:hypothetical protein
MAQTYYIWGTTTAVLAPEAVDKMLRQSIGDVCSSDFGKGLLISYMTRGISVTEPVMSLRRRDLVLFCSLPVAALVTADHAVIWSKNLRSDITDSSEIFLRLDIVATNSVTDVVLHRFTMR